MFDQKWKELTEEEMSKYPNITIICSNYNSDNWIDGYLECVNNIKYPKVDIIFVDAKSTDSSLKTIKNFKFSSHINPKIIECDERIGIYDAWNLAVIEATTEYVVTLNTDDRLFNDSLQLYNRVTIKYPDVDIVYGPLFVVHDPDHNNIVGISDVAEHNHQTLMQNCYCGPFPLLKRQSLIDAGLFNPEFTISGDYEMWARMSKLGYKFLRVHYQLGTYYFNPTGMSSNPDNRLEHIRQDTEIRRLYS